MVSRDREEKWGYWGNPPFRAEAMGGILKSEGDLVFVAL